MPVLHSHLHPHLHPHPQYNCYVKLAPCSQITHRFLGHHTITTSYSPSLHSPFISSSSSSCAHTIQSIHLLFIPHSALYDDFPFMLLLRTIMLVWTLVIGGCHSCPLSLSRVMSCGDVCNACHVCTSSYIVSWPVVLALVSMQWS